MRMFSPSRIFMLLTFTIFAIHFPDAQEVGYEINTFEIDYEEVDKTLRTSTPFTITGVLRKHDIIEEPFYESNMDSIQWIYKRGWTAKSEFFLNDSQLAKEFISLQLRGIDTHAEVFLNGQLIQVCDNMFRTYRVSVKGLLRKSNTIEIKFEPAEKHTLEQWQSLDKEFPGGQRVMSRKAQFQFGWDWAPPAATMGIKDAVILKFSDRIRLDEQYYVQEHFANNTKVKYQFRFSHIGADDVDVLHVLEKRFVSNWYQMDSIWHENLNASKSENVQSVFTIEHPYFQTTWYPSQPRYRIKTYIFNKSEPIFTHTQSCMLKKNELKRQKDAIGSEFKIVKDGITMEVKGVNWVPLSPFYDEIKDEYYYQIFEMLDHLEINMIRVWGGGWYEKELFYDLCDSLGITVWQDFMFAGGIYPSDEPFLENVKAEIKEQVIRLAKHPSVTLFCGNNEIEEAWENWAWQERYSQSERIQISSQYQRLFHDIIPEIVEEYAPHIPYISSSPKLGRGDPDYFNHGPVHDWSVWHDGYPFSHFNSHIPRFMSEFGFQSHPESKSMLAFLSEKDLDLTSPGIQYHQRQGTGQAKMDAYYGRWFDAAVDYKSYAYLSQILQSEGLSQGIHAMREAKERNSGYLLWQLNDAWPAISWSIIDYLFRPKSLYYQLLKDNAPITAVDRWEEGQVRSHLVSDFNEPIVVNLNAYLINTKRNRVSRAMENVVYPLDVKEVRGISEINRRNYRRGGKNSHKILVIDWEYNKRNLRQVIPLGKDYKDIVCDTELPSIEQYYDGEKVILTLKARQVHLWLKLSTEAQGYFSDNHLTLLPGEEKEIYFYPFEYRDEYEFDMMQYDKSLFQ